jgi:hypothetical protein
MHDNEGRAGWLGADMGQAVDLIGTYMRYDAGAFQGKKGVII